ncbi:MAG: hypothetical protein JNL83_00035 [Myxococcales bacterium]|nr:hypothetical protein [Myxococcales bacterium]
MATQNGTTRNVLSHDYLDARLDALKDGIGQMIDRLKAAEQPSRVGAVVARTGDAIKSHPIVAAVIAFGLGFGVFRMLRR